MPGKWLSRRGIVDPLGRAIPVSALSWFRMSPVEGAPGRVSLDAGDEGRVLFRARLAAPAQGIRQMLRLAGLDEERPRGD